jgi:hypothetical protein
MTRLRKAILLVLWLAVATHLYAYLWSTHLDSFPQLPEYVGRWIAKLTGMTDSEDVEQLTLYYVLTISFIVVATLTFLGAVVLWAFQKYRKLR